jgi:hypothetical protein
MKFYTVLSIRKIPAAFIASTLGIFLMLSSCNNNSQEKLETVVVKAFGNTLILDSLENRIPDEMNYDDSTLLADRIINSWVREQVLLAQAEKVIAANDEGFEAKINAYRDALLVNEYETSFVRSRLNSEVSEEEILEFHTSNPELFKLPENVVRAVFVHLPAEETELDSVQFWLTASDSLSIPNLEQWCIEHNAHYAIDIDYWWFLSDLLDQIPLQIYRIEDQIKSRKVFTFTSGGRTYMLQFLEHRLKDLPAPLSIASDRIEDLIIQERRREILENLRDDLVKEAWANGHVVRDSLQH